MAPLLHAVYELSEEMLRDNVEVKGETNLLACSEILCDYYGEACHKSVDDVEHQRNHRSSRAYRRESVLPELSADYYCVSQVVRLLEYKSQQYRKRKRNYQLQRFAGGKFFHFYTLFLFM